MIAMIWKGVFKIPGQNGIGLSKTCLQNFISLLAKSFIGNTPDVVLKLPPIPISSPENCTIHISQIPNKSHKVKGMIFICRRFELVTAVRLRCLQAPPQHWEDAYKISVLQSFRSDLDATLPLPSQARRVPSNWHGHNVTLLFLISLSLHSTPVTDLCHTLHPSLSTAFSTDGSKTRTKRTRHHRFNRGQLVSIRTNVTTDYWYVCLFRWKLIISPPRHYHPTEVK